MTSSDKARALRQYNSVSTSTLLPDQAMTMGLAKMHANLLRLSSEFDATVYINTLDLCDYFGQSSTVAYSVFSEIEKAVSNHQYTLAAERVESVQYAIKGA